MSVPRSRSTSSPNGHAPHVNGQADHEPLFLTPADKARKERLSWLLPARIPLGSVSIVQGAKETGKSTFLRALAAYVTGGPPLIGKRKWKGRGSTVLWFAGEERIGVRVRPGLEAAGADLKRVLVATPWDAPDRGRLELPNDLQRLEDLVRDRAAVLVILDPLFSFVSPAVNLEGPTASARQFMGDLTGLAARTGAAIVMTRNLVKDQSRGALLAGRGSAEVAHAARSVLHLGKDPTKPELYALTVAAGNDTGRPPGLAYALEDRGGMPVWVCRGETDLEADDLADDHDAGLERAELDKAKGLLRSWLKDGEQPSKLIKQAAADGNLSERTLRRACKDLEVKIRHVGRPPNQHTFWRLP
jgi:hypothetical protein